MPKIHTAFLNLGSNIEPEANLRKAIALLKQRGKILQLSQVWESASVGADGPNYLNLCLEFKSEFNLRALKGTHLTLIENQLGRQRSEDKYSPRTIDIDIILFDDQALHSRDFELVFVVVPLADIYPEYPSPLSNDTISQSAAKMRQKHWIQKYPLTLN